jgi:hypothetical protein
MYCPTCGKDNPKKASFCIQCGRPLPIESEAYPSRRYPYPRHARSRGPSSGLLIALLGGFALVLVLILGALVLLLTTVEEEGPTIAEAVASPGVTVQIVVVLPGATGAAEPTPPPTEPALQAVSTPSAESVATATRVPVATTTPSLPAAAAPSSSPASRAAPSPASTPTVGPTRQSSSPTCRSAQRGLIAFKRQNRCDKKGGAACGPVEVWIMNADGSNQAPICSRKAYDWGLVRDRTTPDGEWRVEVTSGKADIMRVNQRTGQKDLIIVNNRKDWDPVLSADGWWLAWVTNRNANDEIYIKTMDWKDQNQRRLTVNEWEWDKHPTWSPDGCKIAFYSNRANSLTEATCQIWVMDVANDRGANLRNLSNKTDSVDTDPVWFKWDDMP